MFLSNRACSSKSARCSTQLAFHVIIGSGSVAAERLLVSRFASEHPVLKGRSWCGPRDVRERLVVKRRTAVIGVSTQDQVRIGLLSKIFLKSAASERAFSVDGAAHAWGFDGSGIKAVQNKTLCARAAIPAYPSGLDGWRWRILPRQTEWMRR